VHERSEMRLNACFMERILKGYPVSRAFRCAYAPSTEADYAAISLVFKKK
jgi:hypothetical protein